MKSIYTNNNTSKSGQSQQRAHLSLRLHPRWLPVEGVPGPRPAARRVLQRDGSRGRRVPHAPGRKHRRPRSPVPIPRRLNWEEEVKKRSCAFHRS